MKYDVATFVSVFLCALLIGGAAVQTHRVEQRDAALAAQLSALNIQQLASRYWACQPLLPGKAFEGDTHTCRMVDAAMEQRAAEAPALQVVDMRQYEVPESIEPMLILHSSPGRVLEGEQHPITPSS